MKVSRAVGTLVVVGLLFRSFTSRDESPPTVPRPACPASRYFEGYTSRCEPPALPIGGGFCEYDGTNACWDWSTLKSAVAGACR